MEGKEDPDNRRDFPSDAFKAEGRKPKEREMVEWTKSWIRLRRDHAAMRLGRLIELFVDDETYVFARQLGAETIVVAFNREDKTKQVIVPVGTIGVKDGVMFKALIGDVSGGVEKGEMRVTLPAQRTMALGAF